MKQKEIHFQKHGEKHKKNQNENNKSNCKAFLCARKRYDKIMIKIIGDLHELFQI